jgi:DNA repair ATPase RecN
VFANEDEAEEVSRLEERRALLQRRLSGWIEELADLPASLRAPVRERLESAAEEVEQINKRLTLLRAAAESARASIVTLPELAGNLQETLAHATLEEKNRILRLAIERVTVVEPSNGRRSDGSLGSGHGRDIEIEWVSLLR